MTITTPSLTATLNKLANDLKTAQPDSNPYEENSLLRDELKALSDRIHSIYQLFPEIEKQSFTKTADGDSLENLGIEVGINRIPATKSTGNISFQGVLGTTISLGTELSDTESNIFETQTEVDVEALSESVSLVAIAGNVVATFSDDHKLGNDFEVIISGASDSDFNGTFTCQAIDSLTIQYTSTNLSLSGSDTGDCDYLLADVSVSSQEYGLDQNRVGGNILSLSTPITNIDTDGIIQQDGLVGGADEETEDGLRVRIQNKKTRPITNMNSYNIINKCLELSYVERAFVLAITPDDGQFTVYVLKIDLSQFNSGELDDVKDNLFGENGVVGVNTNPDDVFILNPTQIETDFEFASITPDSTSMRTAIENSLQSLFDGLDVGETITDVMFNRAILNTATETETITDYELTTPSADITIGAGEIGTLGTLTF